MIASELKELIEEIPDHWPVKTCTPPAATRPLSAMRDGCLMTATARRLIGARCEPNVERNLPRTGWQGAQRC